VDDNKQIFKVFFKNVLKIKSSLKFRFGMNFSVAFAPGLFGSGGTIYLAVSRNGTTITQSANINSSVAISGCLLSLGSYTYPVLEFLNYWPSPQILCSINFKSLLPNRGTGNLSSNFSISNYPGGLPAYIPFLYANNKTMTNGTVATLNHNFQYYIPPSGRPLYGIHFIAKAMAGASCVHARSSYFPDDNPANGIIGNVAVDMRTSDGLGYYPWNITTRPAMSNGAGSYLDRTAYSWSSGPEIAVTSATYGSVVTPGAVNVYCYGESTNNATFSLSMTTNGDDLSKWRRGDIPMISLETYSLVSATSPYDPLIVW
jgi:hypothetical protein